MYQIKGVQRLEAGTHVCSIYRNAEEKLAALVPFLLDGIMNNQKCVCVISKETKDALSQALFDLGLNVGGCNKWGQFLFLDPEDIYLAGGSFDPERVSDGIRNSEREAIREGFFGLRGTGEMAWSNSRRPGTERLIEYEAKLNNLCRESRSVFLCQYDEGLHDSRILRGALRTHPKVNLYGEMRDNPYYTQPDAFLNGVDPDAGNSYEAMRYSLLGINQRS